MGANFWYDLNFEGDPEKIGAAITFIEKEADIEWTVVQDAFMSGGGYFSYATDSEVGEAIREAVNQFGVDIQLRHQWEDEDSAYEHFGPNAERNCSWRVLNDILTEIGALTPSDLGILLTAVQARQVF